MPKRLDRQVIDVVNEATRKLLRDPEVVKRLERQIIDWLYPKLTKEERDESLRARGLPPEETP